MLGLSFEKIALIAVIAIVLVGPDRLPAYAAKLAAFVTALRRMADGAKDRMRDELGPEFDDVDWKKLDPRQYDPRQIIRQALIDEPSPAAKPRETLPIADIGAEFASEPRDPGPPLRTDVAPSVGVEGASSH